MTSTAACESCGMPLETGRTAATAPTTTASFRPSTSGYSRMVAWQERRNPAATREELEAPDPRLHGHPARLARPSRVTQRG